MKARAIISFLAVLLVLAFAAPAAAGFFDALVGGLTWTVELAALLADKQPHLKQIYLRHYGGDGPAGTVHPSLTVTANREVTNVTWERDDFGNAAFLADLEAEILTWQMPESAAAMTLGFDLEFDPGRGLYGVDIKKE
jgi:hypothetical protein